MRGYDHVGVYMKIVSLQEVKSMKPKSLEDLSYKLALFNITPLKFLWVTNKVLCFIYYIDRTFYKGWYSIIEKDLLEDFPLGEYKFD